MIGLVLQGGGAKGSYHIGVWKALRELGIEIGGVTGTSVGALNGAFIAQDKFDRAYEIWHNIDPQMIVKDDPEIYHQLVTGKYDIKNRQMYFDYMRNIIRQDGLNIEPLIEMINKEVDEDLIRQSSIDFGLVTVSLSDFKAEEVFVEDIEEGLLKDYMLGSAYLPAFKSQRLHGKKYLDGGFFDSMPINLISSRGYTEIVAVELGAMGMVRSVKNKKLNIRYISPSGETGSMLEFDKTRSRANLKMGYLDAMKSYGRYEGRSYYLSNVPDESYFVKMVLSLTDEQIVTMAKEVGVKEGYPKRLMGEVIIPELSEMVGLDLKANYREIMIGVLEYLASFYAIDRLKAYDYEALWQEVAQAWQEAPKKSFEFDLIPDILKRSSIVRHNFKAELLVKWMAISTAISD